MINRTLQDWVNLPPEQRADALSDARSAAVHSGDSGIFISVVDNDALWEGGGGSLAGVPIAVKDNIDVAGLPTTGGTNYLSFLPQVDADAVSALRSDGALVIGKTNMHELAFGITSNNGAHGPVRNPWNPALSAGGSSGGSAAAVALGIVPLSMGTDTGGSVSVPAAFCGVAGLRPSTGRYPGDGIIQLSWARDTAGLHANTVADLRFADRLVTGEADRLPDPFPAEVRLGIPGSYLNDLEPAVGKRFEEALSALTSAKVSLVPIELADHFEVTGSSDMVLVAWEAPRTLRSYLRATGLPGLPDDLLAIAQRTASPDVAAVLEQIHENPVPASEYRRAAASRWTLRRQFVSQLDLAGVDAIVFPTAPILPPLLGQDGEVELNGATRSVFATVTRHTAPGTFMGLPMVTVPTASPGAAPVGLTVMGRPFDDLGVLRVSDVLSKVVRAGG